MQNPFSPRARSIIYVVGIVVAAMQPAVAALLVFAGQAAVMPVVVAVGSSVATLVAILAKSNLTDTTPNLDARHRGPETE